MNLFSRLRSPAPEIVRFNISQYLQQIVEQGSLFTLQQSYYAPAVTYSHGKPTERTENSYRGYVYGAYKVNPIVFGLMARRSSLFSEARFMWRRLSKGKPGDLFWNDDLGLLQTPWPNGTTGELLTRMIQDVDLAGNAYLVNEGDRLRRLRPDWTQIILSGNPLTDPVIDVLGYVYTPNGPEGGNSVAFLPDEICHWSPTPDPDATYRGQSWITPVVREIQGDNATTDHKNAFFRNGATLGPIVKAPPGMSEKQFRAFIEESESAHAGKDVAYRTMYLAGGSDVVIARHDFHQLDFATTVGKAETRMAVAAGVPAVIAGISEGLQGSSLNAGNYAAAKRDFVDGTMRTLWRSVCSALASILTVPANAELWYDETDIAYLREDEQDVANINQIRMATILQGVNSGFEPETVVQAVAPDWSDIMAHTGLTSVQLLPPGTTGEPSTQDAQSAEQADNPDDSGDSGGDSGASGNDSQDGGAGDDNEPDGQTRAALDAIDEAIYRAWLDGFEDEIERRDVSSEARIEVGHKGGGRFTTLSAGIADALEKWVKGEGSDDPLAGFSTRQLRTIAEQRGLNPPKGMKQAPLKTLILDHVRQEAVSARTGGRPEGHRRFSIDHNGKRIDVGISGNPKTGSVYVHQESDSGRRGPRVTKDFANVGELEQWARQNGHSELAAYAAMHSGPIRPGTPAKKPMFDPAEVADRLRAAKSEEERISILAGDPSLTAAKLRQVADEVGVSVPEDMRAKTSIQLHIAAHEPGPGKPRTPAAAKLTRVEEAKRIGESVKSRTETPPGYPDRYPVPEERAAWSVPFPNYSPPGYTAPAVLAADVSKAPGVHDAEVENQVRAAYRDAAAAAGRRELVPLADVRDRLGGAQRADVDAALKRMAHNGQATLTEDENRKRLTPRDRAAALNLPTYGSGGDTHWLTIEDPSPQPIPNPDPRKFWADPANVADVNHPFTSYTGRVATDEHGRPVNPYTRTGIQDRGLLGKWGANYAADPIITRVNPQTGELEMASIVRGQPVNGKYEHAIPGGMVDEGEAVSATLGREFEEETGAKLDLSGGRTVYKGYVDDPRNTDNAWMETTAVHRHLTPEEAAKVDFKGPEDSAEVRKVGWEPITPEFLDSLYASHGPIVRDALKQMAADRSTDKGLKADIRAVLAGKETASGRLSRLAKQHEVGKTLAHVDEMLANNASDRALAHRIGEHHQAGEHITGPLLEAAHSGDRERVRAVAADLGRQHGVSLIGKSGETVPFNPELHQEGSAPGHRMTPGTSALVTTPGYHVNDNGAQLVGRKAQVLEAEPDLHDGLNEMSSSQLRSYAQAWEISPYGQADPRTDAQIRAELRARGIAGPEIENKRRAAEAQLDQRLANLGRRNPADTAARDRAARLIAADAKPADVAKSLRSDAGNGNYSDEDAQSLRLLASDVTKKGPTVQPYINPETGNIDAEKLAAHAGIDLAPFTVPGHPLSQHRGFGGLANKITREEEVAHPFDSALRHMIENVNQGFTPQGGHTKPAEVRHWRDVANNLEAQLKDAKKSGGAKKYGVWAYSSRLANPQEQVNFVAQGPAAIKAIRDFADALETAKIPPKKRQASLGGTLLGDVVPVDESRFHATKLRDLVEHRGETLPGSFRHTLGPTQMQFDTSKNPLRPGLTEPESRALDLYAVGAVADKLNGSLRRGANVHGDLTVPGAGKVDLDKVSHDLDAAIEGSTLKHDAVLWRGVVVKQADLNRLVPGAVYTDAGYMSTSAEEHEARNVIGWRKGQGIPSGRKVALFKILAPQGTHGAVGYEKADEVVLPHGQELRVVRVDNSGTDPVIVMEAVPPITSGEGRVRGRADVIDHFDYDKTVKAGQRSYGSRDGDSWMRDIQAEQGFNGKPQVVSKDELDRLINSGQVTELFRGVQSNGEKTAPQLAEEYRTGPFFPGNPGSYGSGTYSSNDVNTANAYAHGEPGAVIRMGLRRDARVVAYADILKLRAKYTSSKAAQALADQRTEELSKVDPTDTEAVEKIINKYDQMSVKQGGRARVTGDEGRLAALLGFDAIRVPVGTNGQGDYYVVLNRTATIVQAAQ